MQEVFVMDDDRLVECCDHGPQEATFVCQYLAGSVRSGHYVGFHCADSSSRSDAWCDVRQRVRLAEGEWNDRSEAFAGITLLCGACHDIARRLNETG